MKLRIRGNSIRLRLSMDEVEAFGNTGKVSDSIVLGTGQSDRLTYGLISSDKADRVSTEYSENRIEVVVPEKIARNWVDREDIGFKTEYNLNGNGSLSILVEKDFACLKERPGEDESDKYPHPKAAQC